MHKIGFNIEKIYLYNNDNEKCNIITGRDTCQNIGLDILNSMK